MGFDGVRRGSRGFARTPPFDLQKILHTLFNCKSGPLGSLLSENHRCPNEFGYSYASLLVEDEHGTRAEAVYATAMKGRA